MPHHDLFPEVSLILSLAAVSSKRWILTLLLLLAPAGAAMGQAPPLAKVSVEWRIEPAVADLTDVRGLLVSPAGEVEVLHRLDGGLRFFGPNKESGVIGSAGQGPGEFRDISAVGWRGDTLWVADDRRISFFNRVHKYLGSIPVPDSVRSYSSRVTGLLPDGSLRVSRGFSAPPRRPWFVPVDSLETIKYRVTRDGQFVAIVAHLQRNLCEWPYQAGGARGVHTLPFCNHRMSSDSAPASSILLGLYRDPEVQSGQGTFHAALIDWRGKVLFDRTLSYTPIAVPRSLVDAYTKRLDSAGPQWGYPKGFAKAVAAAPPPTNYPPVKGLFVAKDSSLWLELETGAKSEHRWRVLKRDGTIDFDLTVPENIRIMAADRGRAWAVESDPDGVQGVVRYKVVRP